MTRSVIFNQDAAIDEYMAMAMLTVMDDVTFKGTVITNADCIDGPAMQAAWRILSYIGHPELDLTLSKARGYNPFPWSYRSDCIKQNGIAALRDVPPKADWPAYPDGDVWLTRTLEAAEDGEITMLVNCPLTTLRNVLELRPELEKKIGELIWMGGAIDVPGNLDPTTVPAAVANPYAEWNAFWDPYAVDWIFKNTCLPIIIFPLDVTDEAPISQPFMSSLLEQSRNYRWSELAFQSYGLVYTEAFYDMWDVLTTCYIPHPEFFAPPETRKLAMVTDGPNQGALVPDNNGREVQVVLELVDADAFYDYVLAMFKRN